MAVERPAPKKLHRGLLAAFNEQRRNSFMKHRIFFALALITALSSSTALAQEGQGPQVPCVGCDLGVVSYPETGI